MSDEGQRGRGASQGEGSAGATDRPRGARAQKKAESRRKILESARDVFFRVGFMNANLDEVAHGAGVAKGTLYRYFDSKAELYVAVLAHNGEIFREKMAATRDPSLSAADQIRRTGHFYFEHWTARRDYFQIFWALENQAVIGELPPAVIGEVTRLWEECLRILADIVEQGIVDGELACEDPWEVANVLWTLANGLIQCQNTAARRDLLRRNVQHVFDDAINIVLRGLEARDGGAARS